MQAKMNNIDEYLKSLTIERRLIIDQLRTVISDNLPYGFKEQLAYDLIAELCRKMSVEEYIKIYERSLNR